LTGWTLWQNALVANVWLVEHSGRMHLWLMFDMCSRGISVYFYAPILALILQNNIFTLICASCSHNNVVFCWFEILQQLLQSNYFLIVFLSVKSLIIKKMWNFRAKKNNLKYSKHICLLLTQELTSLSSALK